MGTRDVETNPQKGWNRFSVAFVVQANAANQSACRLRNPLLSGKVAIIEKVLISDKVAGDVHNIFLGTSVVDLGNPTDVAASMDSPGGSIVSGMTVSHQNNPAPPALGNPGLLSAPAMGVSTLTAITNYDLILTDNSEFVLNPGSALQIITVQINTLLNAFIWWRER